MNHFSTFLDRSFEEGMGVLTEIDVQTTLKKKIDVNFRKYTNLGACHPVIAYQMLQTDDKAGVFYCLHTFIDYLRCQFSLKHPDWKSFI